jgi:tetratricopeptide (TPR) repeat protein
MVEFGSGYIMAMDRGYGAPSLSDTATNDVGIAPIRDIGFSVPFGIAAGNVQGVAAKIRTGTRIMELQFSGAGKGNRQSQTPGLYGKLQRQALEELGRINKVDFTTHATWNVMGLAGMDQQGNFSKQNKKFSIDEIKRAIDFASDVARGGNVVVHTGEFQRPISEEIWAKDEQGRQMFQNYKEEPERAIFRVVDERDGQVITQARKNRRVARPVWLTAKAGEVYTDDQGNEQIVQAGEKVYIDYDNKKVVMEDRVPEFDREKGRIKTHYWNWNDFEREAKERTEEARTFWRKYKNNPEKWENKIYFQFRNARSEDEIEVYPEEAYVHATLETNAANAKGWALYYGENIEDARDQLNKLRKALKLYEKIEEDTPEDERWKLQREAGSTLQGILPPEMKFPTEQIRDAMRKINKQIEYSRQTSLSQEQQAADSYEQMKYVQSHRRYGLNEAYDSYAEAAIHAMRKSDEIEKQGKLKQPLFVAMENIFPESYGGHPDELIDLVTGARKAMVKQLMVNGYSEKDAQKEAEEHVKGHLDTGHLNMWRKYWVGRKDLTPEQNDENFNNWALGKVEQMAKMKLIGSVHLTDNLGYQDEHLSPGQGNTPMTEMVKILKKNGYDGPLVVEPGADAATDLSDFHGLMKTWRLFGSPIYGVGAGLRTPGRQRHWGQVQYSYFGQNEPPYFVFGRYSPSEDWTLWSGVPME